VLVEVGLLIRPEDGGASYDRFRGRVMFPIADRRGHVIAFGGRVMGDGQPKYLNSPETPLFQKGRTLYAHHLAREAAASSREVVVVEGYMDVVALHKAGFRTAVAPLGTALTEDQLVELWRIAQEPFLCFDGDKAGQRAAARAAERAMPLLEPGRSLRFVTLPDGQDPDDLVKNPGGSQLFRDLMLGARPLADVLWEQELAAHPVDTPERRAEFRRRLRELVGRIGDRDVREFYTADFAERQARLFDSGRGTAPRWGGQQRNGAFGGGKGGGRWKGFGQPQENYMKAVPAALLDAERSIERQDVRAFLAAMLNHRPLIDDFHEVLAEITFADDQLDRLRAEIVNTVAGEPGLDASGLQNHLAESGHGAALSQVVSRDVHKEFAYTRPEASLDDARERCADLLGRLIDRRLVAERRDAERRAVEMGTPEAWAQFRALFDREVTSGAAEDDESATPRWIKQ
jgi:DNA primase